MKKIDEFILNVQKAVCKVKRNAENDHHKSKYADLEGVLDLLNPFFTEANVMVDQSPYMHKFYPEGTSPPQDPIWVLRTVLTIGEEFRTWDLPLLGYDSKTPMQSLGSAITFARRYQLKGIFKLVDSDDDGNAVTPSGAPSKPARKSEIDKMLRAFAGLHVSRAEVEAMVQADVESFTLEDMSLLQGYFKALKAGEKKKDDLIPKNGSAEWQE